MNVKVAYEDESGQYETIVPIEKMNEIPGTILQVHLGTGEHCTETGVEIFEGDWIRGKYAVDYLVKFGKFQRQPFDNRDAPHEHICFYLEQYSWNTWNLPEKVCREKEPFLEHPGVYNIPMGYRLIQEDEGVDEE